MLISTISLGVDSTYLPKDHQHQKEQMFQISLKPPSQSLYAYIYPWKFKFINPKNYWIICDVKDL